MTDNTNGSGHAARRPLAVLFGGNGFVGGHLAALLGTQGWRVRVVSRQAGGAGDLPDIAYRRGDICGAPADIADAVDGADAVVNLAGILTQSAKQTFDAVHRKGAATIAAAAAHAGVRNFVHLSAIGADAVSPSAYARSKAAGEEAVLSAFPNAVILRPSIIFGPQDDFFNRFAAMARLSPALPLIGGGRTLFQPVYVGDVAAAIAQALAGKARAGAVYELGGPERRSFADLLRYIGSVTGRRRLLMPIPFALAAVMAAGIEAVAAVSDGHFPKMLLITRDQVASLRTDNVVSPAAQGEGRTLAGLGIAPRNIEAIVPGFLAGK